MLARFPVLACTDVTGFGLAGHAAEMAAGPHCGLTLRYRDLPLLPGVEEYAAMGLVPAATHRNKTGRLASLNNPEAVPAIQLDVLFDPQTSGGLLAAVPLAVAAEALAALAAAGVTAWQVGTSGGAPGQIGIDLR